MPDNKDHGTRALSVPADPGGEVADFDALTFSNRVERRLLDEKLTYRAAEKLTGVDKSALHRIVSRAEMPTVPNYVRLERWLAQPNPERPANEEQNHGR